ncbi:MAG: hypothetical protein ACXV5Q_09430, partial [Frankiaceae bacterium]
VVDEEGPQGRCRRVGRHRHPAPAEPHGFVALNHPAGPGLLALLLSAAQPRFSPPMKVASPRLPRR